MDAFPAFFPLAGARVVIAGDGEGADAKARLFEGSAAEVVRLQGEAALDPAAYAGAALIFVASYDEAFARAMAAAARGSGAPLNVVDRPGLSDFHTPAIIDRGRVVAAIGTAGAAPLLASLLRAEIELRIPPGAGRIAGLLGDRREALREAFPDLAARRAFLRAILAGPATAAAQAGDEAAAADLLDAALASAGTGLGRVTFIDAPAAPDLISVRAVRALNIADILLFSETDAPLIATHARRDAEHWTPAMASATAILDQVAAGRLIAIVGAAGPADLEQSLAEAGATVERLAPAPGP
jgi:precorrin-2 dehydrogenase/sirohydrochlorin ferrochelatase